MIKKITILIIIVFLFFNLSNVGANSLSLNKSGQQLKHWELDASIINQNENKWINCLVDTKGEVGQESSIAIDSKGKPHICYIDEKNHILKYAYWTGTKWQIETIDSEADVSSMFGFVSLAIDKNDKPHILYTDEWMLTEFANYGGIKYATREKGKWNTQFVVKDNYDSSGNTCCYSTQSSRSIALDNDNNPHIVFCFEKIIDQEHWVESIKYGYLSNGEWKIDSIDSVENNYIGWELNLVLDKNDKPHICYKDKKNECIKYASSSEEWKVSIIKLGNVGNPSIAIDSNNKPHISYHDIATGDLVYAYFQNSWTFQKLTKNERGTKNPIFIDEMNRPHICYVSFDGSTKIKHMYYDTNWIKETVAESYKGDYWLATTISDFIIDKEGNLHLTYWKQKYFDLEYSTTMGVSLPPLKPTRPDGPSSVQKFSEKKFIFSAEDPESDEVYFYIDWGQGDMELKGPYYSGEKATIKHRWSDEKTYNIRYMAIDNFGAYSEWSDPLTISVSRNKQSRIILDFFEKLMDKISFFEFFHY
jgi:hypothetical protein